ncbi:MAG: HDOD domain-containing protein [Candidatus Aminicenantes bacterium]|nr:MAG: HDOD domain-containing protein [Candidatus Aminicenantes bacterium]
MIEKNVNEPNPMQEIVVTRRPIFDRKKDVFAYELLFKSDLRDSIKSIKSRKDAADDSSLTAVDSLLINGLKRLSSGKRAVIHFNHQMLLSEFPFMFPNNLLGIEIQEDVDPENKVTSAVEKIKKAGYLVFVTEYVFNEADISLVKLADIVGVDFRSQGIQKRRSLFEGTPVNLRFLAKSIETAADFELAADSGYHYFQGEFFSRAEMIAFRNIPSYKLNLMRILKEINKPAVEFDKIEKILQKDVSITYKLLRFVNSASFGFKTTVQSIRHALALLGETEVRKWLSFIVLSSMGTDKPLELIRTAIIRAKFCESIAAALNFKNDLSNFFLMGMFSMVDAFLGRPMDEILVDLPLTSAVKAALLGKHNHFRSVLELVIDYERGDWKRLMQMANILNLDEQIIASFYLDAVEWGKFL